MTHLVLPPPPDVPAERELLLRELVFAEEIVELVHGQVDDVGTGDREPQGGGLPLVPVTDHPLISRELSIGKGGAAVEQSSCREK